MKPVIEAIFKPFESVRFRQNASLVSKDQLAARQHQAISQYRLKVRQAQNYGISSPESMTCIQDIRQAFDLRDTSPIPKEPLEEHRPEWHQEPLP